jgi:hypothetical protein
MGDRSRMVLIGIITTLVCAIMVYATFFHLTF